MLVPKAYSKHSKYDCKKEILQIYVSVHVSKLFFFFFYTTHFLNTIEELPALKPGAILCTLDVDSLYTNIPNLEGLRATAKHLIKHRTDIGNLQPLNSSLCQILNMVLTMNNFRFNGEHFLQIGGTAMGTRVAPTYANLFMADFEETYVYTYPTQPTLWVRFIDDIFIIWEHGPEELQKFLDHLNRVHNTIKFTSHSSREKVNFLDTWISTRTDGFLDTDLYRKPTDSNNYLEFTSAHPYHTKKGIPLGQFLRLHRICREKSSFVEHSIDKGKHFLRRGYPLDLIKQAFLQALHSDRATLLKHDKEKEAQENVNILVSTYNPGFRGLRPLVQNNWDILGRSCSTRKIHQNRLIAAYKKPKNLKDLLVRAKLPTHNPDTRNNAGTPHPSNPCHTRLCRYCPRLNKTGRIRCHATNREYVTKHNVTCKSSNVIYCISCKKCGMQYVGQTKNRLMDRFQAHFYNIGHNRPNSEMARHFNQPDHKGMDDIEIHIVDFIHAHPASNKAKYLRDLVEFNWTQWMHTMAPVGLNLMDPG